MDLDHINTIGLATTIIAAPVFTGIYTLGSMMYYYTSNAMINTFSVNEAAKFIPSVTNTITEAAKETAKFIPGAANAVALRATNAIVAVKQVVEPICEAIKPQPLMIAPPPVIAPTIIPVSVPTASIDLINMTNINTTAHTVAPTNINTPMPYGNMFRFLVDGYRIGGKIENGDYLQAGAYGIGVALDYAVNETLSTTAGTYIESMTGSSAAGLLVKAIFSISTSIALRKVVPFFAEGVYSYFIPTPAVAAEQKNPVIKNQPIAVVKIEEKNIPKIQKTATVINIIENNLNTNTNTVINKSEVEKKKPTPKIRRETSDERQFKRKLAELGVVEQENATSAPETIVTTVSSKKKQVQKQHRMTSKERQFERKLAALMMPAEQGQKQEQDENKYVEPNHDVVLNKRNDYGFVLHCDKVETTSTAVSEPSKPLSNTTNTPMPTPAQSRDTRLFKKAASEKANLVQVVAIDGQPRELSKKSFKDNSFHSDLNITVTNTGNVKSISSTLRVENNDAAPLLDGAKFVCNAIVNLFDPEGTKRKSGVDMLSSAKPIFTPAKNLDWARKESDEFWTQATHRSHIRMKKAEKHLNETLESKYSDEPMIERARSMFNDSKEMYKKDSDYLRSIPRAAVNF